MAQIHQFCTRKDQEKKFRVCCIFRTQQFLWLVLFTPDLIQNMGFRDNVTTQWSLIFDAKVTEQALGWTAERRMLSEEIAMRRLLESSSDGSSNVGGELNDEDDHFHRLKRRALSSMSLEDDSYGSGSDVIATQKSHENARYYPEEASSNIDSQLLLDDNDVSSTQEPVASTTVTATTTIFFDINVRRLFPDAEKQIEPSKPSSIEESEEEINDPIIQAKKLLKLLSPEWKKFIKHGRDYTHSEYKPELRPEVFSWKLYTGELLKADSTLVSSMLYDILGDAIRKQSKNVRRKIEKEGGMGGGYNPVTDSDSSTAYGTNDLTESRNIIEEVTSDKCTSASCGTMEVSSSGEIVDSDTDLGITTKRTVMSQDVSPHLSGDLIDVVDDHDDVVSGESSDSIRLTGKRAKLFDLLKRHLKKALKNVAEEEDREEDINTVHTEDPSIQNLLLNKDDLYKQYLLGEFKRDYLHEGTYQGSGFSKAQTVSYCIASKYLLNMNDKEPNSYSESGYNIQPLIKPLSSSLKNIIFALNEPAQVPQLRTDYKEDLLNHINLQASLGKTTSDPDFQAQVNIITEVNYIDSRAKVAFDRAIEKWKTGKQSKTTYVDDNGNEQQLQPEQLIGESILNADDYKRFTTLNDVIEIGSLMLQELLQMIPDHGTYRSIFDTAATTKNRLFHHEEGDSFSELEKLLQSSSHAQHISDVIATVPSIVDNDVNEFKINSLLEDTHPRDSYRDSFQDTHPRELEGSNSYSNSLEENSESRRRLDIPVTDPPISCYNGQPIDVSKCLGLDLLPNPTCAARGGTFAACEPTAENPKQCKWQPSSLLTHNGPFVFFKGYNTDLPLPVQNSTFDYFLKCQNETALTEPELLPTAPDPKLRSVPPRPNPFWPMFEYIILKRRPNPRARHVESVARDPMTPDNYGPNNTGDTYLLTAEARHCVHDERLPTDQWPQALGRFDQIFTNTADLCKTTEIKPDPNPDPLINDLCLQQYQALFLLFEPQFFVEACQYDMVITPCFFVSRLTPYKCLEVGIAQNYQYLVNYPVVSQFNVRALTAAADNTTLPGWTTTLAYTYDDTVAWTLEGKLQITYNEKVNQIGSIILGANTDNVVSIPVGTAEYNATDTYFNSDNYIIPYVLWWNRVVNEQITNDFIYSALGDDVLDTQGAYSKSMLLSGPAKHFFQLPTSWSPHPHVDTQTKIGDVFRYTDVTDCLARVTAGVPPNQTVTFGVSASSVLEANTAAIVYSDKFGAGGNEKRTVLRPLGPDSTACLFRDPTKTSDSTLMLTQFDVLPYKMPQFYVLRSTTGQPVNVPQIQTSNPFVLTTSANFNPSTMVIDNFLQGSNDNIALPPFDPKVDLFRTGSLFPVNTPPVTSTYGNSYGVFGGTNYDIDLNGYRSGKVYIPQVGGTRNANIKTASTPERGRLYRLTYEIYVACDQRLGIPAGQNSQPTNRNVDLRNQTDNFRINSNPKLNTYSAQFYDGGAPWFYPQDVFDPKENQTAILQNALINTYTTSPHKGENFANPVRLQQYLNRLKSKDLTEFTAFLQNWNLTSRTYVAAKLDSQGQMDYDPTWWSSTDYPASPNQLWEEPSTVSVTLVSGTDPGTTLVGSVTVRITTSTGTTTLTIQLKYTLDRCVIASATNRPVRAAMIIVPAGIPAAQANANCIKTFTELNTRLTSASALDRNVEFRTSTTPTAIIGCPEGYFPDSSCFLVETRSTVIDSVDGGATSVNNAENAAGNKPLQPVKDQTQGAYFHQMSYPPNVQTNVKNQFTPLDVKIREYYSTCYGGGTATPEARPGDRLNFVQRLVKVLKMFWWMEKNGRCLYSVYYDARQRFLCFVYLRLKS